MIKILKQTPATINGRGCNELLVHDDAITCCTCCDLCCYRDWIDYSDAMATCMDVHGCTPDANTYFLAEQLTE